MNGTKYFTLNAEPVRWEYQKGKSIVAWAFNGQVPGPEIRVTEGDKVVITFNNKLPKGTTIHWHGLDLPNNMDGVPGITQEVVKAGESFTYEFTATPAGTRFYHTHGSMMGDEAQQSDMGLSGAFIVEPKGYQKPDKEYTVVLDDWQKGEGSFNKAMTDMNMEGMAMNMDYNLFTMNGLAFPDTKNMEVKKGDKVRIRLINASASTTHPMHLHGQQFKITATDGNPVPEAAQLTRNVVTLNPGETYDIEFTASNEGVWAFHCHELHHADAGMMTLLKYEGFNLPIKSSTSSQDTQNMEGMEGM
ncbi:MAG: copper oxidase [Candidatus Microsaccharimonas sp.]